MANEEADDKDVAVTPPPRAPKGGLGGLVAQIGTGGGLVGALLYGSSQLADLRQENRAALAEVRIAVKELGEKLDQRVNALEARIGKVEQLAAVLEDRARRDGK